MALLKELLNKGYYSIHEGFDNWEDALRASVEPLIRHGAVRPQYADSIIESVKKFGNYIVIAPNIAIPHAEDYANVNETCICFMKSNRPVEFSDDPDEHAQLFFVLASNDEAKHLSNLKMLMALLCDEELVNRLTAVTTTQEFVALCNGTH